MEVDLFKKYLYHMQNEKEYNPFTINIRIRTLKPYLKWLYNEKYISTDINIKVIKVKVPQDFTVPLTDNDIKRLLGNCDTSTYAGYRDYCIIITILDCGIRIHELCVLKNKDIDLKHWLIKASNIALSLNRIRNKAGIEKRIVEFLESNSGTMVLSGTHMFEKHKLVLEVLEKYLPKNHKEY